jgi:butyrate kinase
MNLEVPPLGGESEENQYIEQGQKAELKEELEQLNQRADTVGDQLENVDLEKLGSDRICKIGKTVERVLGGLYLVAGVVSVDYVWATVDDFGHQMDSAEKLAAAIAAVTGLTIGVRGLDKLITGAKSFWGGLTREQKAELRD